MKARKRILLVSSAFYPEISPRSFRATELAKEFYRLGHEVTVITKHRDFDYSNFLAKYPIKFQMWSRSRLKPINSIEFFRILSLNGIFNRLLSLLFEYPAIEEMFKVKKALSLVAGYDVMISFAVPYPVQWGAAWAWRKEKKIASTWIADCGDPYMGDRLDSFRKMFYFAYLEKSFCKQANYIAIPVESARPAYYKEFQSKIRIIPQGFSFDLDKTIVEPNNVIPQFAYAGGFLKGIRDPSQLLEFLTTIESPFRFYVFTNQDELLNPYKKRLEDKLIVSDFIPRNDLMIELSKMDFLINFDNGTTLNVPSKLIDYAITNRPVLNIDSQLKKDEIEAFINKDYSRRMPLPTASDYHINNIATKFIKLF